MICPMCNANGFICKTKIIDLDINLFICGKCSTCWSKDPNESSSIFRSLSEFLNKHGFQYGAAEIEGIKLVCQMCGQGEIYKAKVIPSKKALKVCNKCSACWAQEQMITMQTFKSLSTYLEEQDLQQCDIEIEGPITLCPRCDGQGEIYKAKLANTGIELNICDECEACWPKNEFISSKTFKNLSTFLEERGLQYNKIKIERF